MLIIHAPSVPESVRGSNDKKSKPPTHPSHKFSSTSVRAGNKFLELDSRNRQDRITLPGKKERHHKINGSRGIYNILYSHIATNTLNGIPSEKGTSLCVGREFLLRCLCTKVPNYTVILSTECSIAPFFHYVSLS